MRQIDKPYIRKTYQEDEQELVVIYLEDTRDSYIDEDALGKIGSISIAKGYVSFSTNNSDPEKAEDKEQVLSETFKEIFGAKQIDTTSNVPYETIKGMIADGTLETLGYIKEQSPEDIYSFEFERNSLEDNLSNFNYDDEEFTESLEELFEPFRPRRR